MLFRSRLDSMISSYLGTTSKNIRNLFEYAQKIPCVLFLDEFDAIGKARDDNNELGELKRVVNSLLQNIDNLNNNTLLIAATNHETLLDKAIWRRFNYKLKVDFPDYESRKKLVKLFINNIANFTDKEIDLISLAIGKISGADIEEIIIKAIRKSIVYNYELKLNNIFEEIFLYKFNFDGNEDVKNELKNKARYLRDIDEKLFSYSTIGKILGISKTKVSSILNS